MKRGSVRILIPERGEQIRIMNLMYSLVFEIIFIAF